MSGPRITDAAVEAGARKLFAAHTDVAGDWDEPDYAGLRAWALEDAEDILTAALPHIRRAVIEELIGKYEAQLVEVERNLRFDDITNVQLWHTLNTLRAEMEGDDRG